MYDIEKQGDIKMKLNQYQTLAARTIGCTDTEPMKMHALLGLASECGELSEAYYLEPVVKDDHAVKELGDMMWMIAELCTAYGWKLQTVLKTDEWPLYREMQVQYLVRDVGYLLGLYQKTYQGHALMEEAVQKTLRKIYRGILSVVATLDNVTIDTVLWINIEKLEKRYPDHRFDPEHSLHRAQGDI